MENIKLRKSNRQSKLDRRMKQPISKREMQIAKLTSHGKLSKEIASELFLSKFTVDKHLKNTKRKLSISNNAKLSRWVTEYENGLIHFSCQTWK
jgi:two-component system, NarL family, response regulator NreC